MKVHISIELEKARTINELLLEKVVYFNGLRFEEYQKVEPNENLVAYYQTKMNYYTEILGETQKATNYIEKKEGNMT